MVKPHTCPHLSHLAKPGRKLKVTCGPAELVSQQFSVGNNVYLNLDRQRICGSKLRTKSLFSFSWDILDFRAFTFDTTAEVWTEKWGETKEKTCSKGPKGGIEPGAAAVRTQPLYMGCVVTDGSKCWH